ncbi:hypothetical protein T492DRAFT_1070063 [Pavlovales sp. CCMP2436]|nr:hypothetical protein T492DRAFT_1070063 [Pavlovales sp. CCMP2436]
MARFRPNIVVDNFNCGGPFAEDRWRFPLRIGDALFASGVPYPRCTVPDVCQDSGGVSDLRASPMRTLHAVRNSPAGINFGMYLYPAAGGVGDRATVRIGDVVSEEEAAPPGTPIPDGSLWRALWPW